MTKVLLQDRTQCDVCKTDKKRQKNAAQKKEFQNGFVDRSYFRILGRVIPS